MRDCVLGLDIGTTNAKALVVDAHGEILSKASAGYGLILGQEGWIEQDPEELWAATITILRDAVRGAGLAAGRISALALSTQRDTLVAVDRHNKPVRNAITWMDSRSMEQCTRLGEAVGIRRVYELTGVPISNIWTLAFILWMRDEEPEIFERTACFGLVEDFLLNRLGAPNHVLDTSSACQTMLFDLRAKQWCEELMTYAGLDARRLPLLNAPGSVVGCLSSEIALAVGLPEGVRLVLGAGDQQCAALGAGAVRPGDLSLSIGTASNLLTPVADLKLDPDCKVLCHIAATEESHVLETALLATGATMEWLRRTVYADVPDDNFFTLVNREAAGSPIGSGGLLLTPHFEGAGSPYWDNDARGLLLGLNLSTRRGDLARAIMEGVALELRKNVGLLQRLDAPIHRVVVTGGASKSSLWMQILSDVLNLPVEILHQTECAALGAGALAAIGAGLIESAVDATAWARIAHRFMPDAQNARRYDRLFTLHGDACEALREKDVYHGLSAFRGKFIQDNQ